MKDKMNVTVIYKSCLYFEVVWSGRAEPVMFVFQAALTHKHRAQKETDFSAEPKAQTSFHTLRAQHEEKLSDSPL